MKNKIKTILVILLIIVGIKGFIELIREEPISNKVETVTILDCRHDMMIHSEDYRVKFDTHDGWIHTISTDRNIYNYCTNNIGKDIKLTIKRSKPVHSMKDDEILRIVGY